MSEASTSAWLHTVPGSGAAPVVRFVGPQPDVEGTAAVGLDVSVAALMRPV